MNSISTSSPTCGFVENTGSQRVDLTAQLITHPAATFLMKAQGNTMREAGIGDGDVLVVDKAVRPRNGHVVVAVVDGEMVCKTLHLRAGRMKLKTASPGFADIVPKEGQTIEVWGVVTYVIKALCH
jgi:DNA polymerase V